MAIDIKSLSKEQVESFEAVVVGFEARLLGLPKTMGQGFHQLAKMVEEQGLKMVGEPFVQFYDLDWVRLLSRGKWQGLLNLLQYRWKFEVGIPVHGEVSPKGPIRFRRFHGFLATTAIHYGPYREMSDSYRTLYQWSHDKGLEPETECLELYYNRPVDTPSVDLKTKLILPVKDRFSIH